MSVFEKGQYVICIHQYDPDCDDDTDDFWLMDEGIEKDRVLRIWSIEQNEDGQQELTFYETAFFHNSRYFQAVSTPNDQQV